MATLQKRVANDGSTSYRVQIRLKGQKPETATFNRITDAKRWAAQTEAAIREGRYFKAAPARKQTLADLIDRYILEVLPTKPLSQAKASRGLIPWLLTPAGHGEVQESAYRRPREAPGRETRGGFVLETFCTGLPFTHSKHTASSINTRRPTRRITV